MIEYNRQLKALSEKCARKKKLEAELEDLYKQRKILQDKAYQLKSVMWSENADVERLEGKSLYAFFYFVIGKKDEMLTKEKEEAYAARVKYDTAEAELNAVLNDIQSYLEELKELRNCETEYAKVLKEKAAAMKAAGAKEAEEILKLEEQILAMDNLKREIREARSAGQRSKNIAESVLESLSNAKNWSTYDMIAGDGIISHMAKHEHLNTAQTNVEELQIALRRFRTELTDIRITADLKVNIDGFLGFADFFFDGLFADWAVRSRINNSLEEVHRINSQIVTALQKLSSMYSSAEAKLEDLNKKYDEIISKS